MLECPSVASRRRHRPRKGPQTAQDTATWVVATADQGSNVNFKQLIEPIFFFLGPPARKLAMSGGGLNRPWFWPGLPPPPLFLLSFGWASQPAWLFFRCPPSYVALDAGAPHMAEEGKTRRAFCVGLHFFPSLRLSRLAWKRRSSPPLASACSYPIGNRAWRPVSCPCLSVLSTLVARRPTYILSNLLGELPLKTCRREQQFIYFLAWGRSRPSLP